MYHENLFFKLLYMYMYFFLVDLKTIKTQATPINVDRTPPTIGTVRDGSTHNMDADYSYSDNELCITWAGFSDPHSGISQVQWGADVDITGNYSVVPLHVLSQTEVELRRTCREVELEDGETYYSVLVVTNGAGDNTTAYSNGGMQH